MSFKPSKKDIFAPEGAVRIRCFSVENFLSFETKTTLNFCDQTQTQSASGWIVEKADADEPAGILKISGASGTGKTNLLKALAFVTSFISASFSKKEQILPTLQTWRYHTEPSAFELESQDSLGKIYIYRLIIAKTGVISEELRLRATDEKKPEKVVFYRKGDRLISSIRAFDAVRKIGLSSDVSVISTLLHFTAASPWEKIGIGYGNVKPSTHLSKDALLEEALSFYDKSAYSREASRKFLKRVYPAVKEIKIETDHGKLKAYAGYETEAGSLFWIDFRDESDSFKYLYSLLASLPCFLELGGLFWIDRLEAELHPELIEFLQTLFTDKNINKGRAQLIYTP